ncbi:hypothetical protein HBB16_18595 [Pseudonocardia sp. MCCB 268]|nr:hypothetical protein [Pseudonocardia cytotoxica]
MVDVARVLERELARPGWRREHVAMGTNTDPLPARRGSLPADAGRDLRTRGQTRRSSILTRAPSSPGPPRTGRRERRRPGRDRGVDRTAGPRPAGAARTRTPEPAGPLDLVRRITDARLPCRGDGRAHAPWLTGSRRSTRCSRRSRQRDQCDGARAAHLRPGTGSGSCSGSPGVPGVAAALRRLYRQAPTPTGSTGPRCTGGSSAAGQHGLDRRSTAEETPRQRKPVGSGLDPSGRSHLRCPTRRPAS